MMEFSVCAKTHKNTNAFPELLRMKVCPQVSEHKSMFNLINLLDKGEPFFFFFFVIIWNMYSISKKLEGNFILASETQHLLSDLKLNYPILQSP